MKWEYKVEKLRKTPLLRFKFDETKFENHINELGQQEWELAATFSITRFADTKKVIVVFKRPKQ
ncbi:MAG: DUF4177 domain-containing protein [Planctomycetota bacterium]|jgi:hypothetical protein